MSNPTWHNKDIGPVSAWALAVEDGYTGTKEEWLASFANTKDNADRSEKFATGEIGGEDVPETDPAYHNNAEYYAGQAAGSATAAANQALKSEGYAVGKQNGTDVESGSDYYQNNAEYFKDQAAGSATAAAASAADALEHTQSVIHTWLETNIDPDSGYALDRTLTEPLEAAPADMVGALRSALINSYEYIELQHEEIASGDHGYYTPSHPSVGDSLSFTSSESYTCFKYDLTNFIGKKIYVHINWISWTFAAAIVDENNKVLAAATKTGDNNVFTWEVTVPSNSKYLLFNGYMWNLGNYSTTAQAGKYDVVKPVYKNEIRDDAYGNTEKYKDVQALSVQSGVVISKIDVNSQFSQDKVTAEASGVVKVYSVKNGDKWHIHSRNNYYYPAYMVLNMSMECVKSSFITVGTDAIDEIISISADGFIILQYPSTMTSAFCRKAYKFASDKKSISGLKIAICGDSIMAGANGNAVGNLLSIDYDVVPQSLAVSGATMSAKPSGNSHICEQVQSIASDVDLIILEGGVNDFWNSSITFGTFLGDQDTTTALDDDTFCGALETALRWIRDNRPHIPVLYVINHHIKTADYLTNADGHTFQDYRNVVLQAAQNYGFMPVRVDLTAFNTTITQTDYEEYSDGGAHPTDKGYRRWYLPLIVEAIQKSIG